MPRPKKPPPKAPPIAPSGTTHLFNSRKPNDRGAAITSERIASDLDAFREAGGRIEVLGVTRSLTRIGVDSSPAPDAPARPPARLRR